MNVLFVHSIDDILSPDKPLRTPAQMQFGISYISSFLKSHGHRTRLIVLSRMLGKTNNKKRIDDCLAKFNPRLVCFGAVSTEYNFITDAAKYIKKNYPEKYLLAGGPHVSLNPEGVLPDGFDALCIGEGEYPALELVSQLEEGVTPSGIRNLWIGHGGAVEKNPTRPFIQNLDELPFPDREMWREWTGSAEGSKHSILLGRGCPFECTYCCNHALKTLAAGRYVRFRSPDNIVKEIEGIAAAFPSEKEYYLEVETIGADKRWAMELCAKLEGLNSSLKHPLSYEVNLRVTPSLDFENLFDAFRKSNFVSINVGIESGSERVRREILNRNYSNQDIAKVVASARRHGLRVNFYNLIGVPGETADDFRETIDINRACLPDRVYAHIFYPYPGTKLYFTCKKQGLLKDGMATELERCKATLDLPGFSKKQIQKSFVWFDYNVYKGARPAHALLAKVLISLFRSNVILHYFYRRLTYSSIIKRIRSLTIRY